MWKATESKLRLSGPKSSGSRSQFKKCLTFLLLNGWTIKIFCNKLCKCCSFYAQTHTQHQKVSKHCSHSITAHPEPASGSAVNYRDGLGCSDCLTCRYKHTWTRNWRNWTYNPTASEPLNVNRIIVLIWFWCSVLILNSNWRASHLLHHVSCCSGFTWAGAESSDNFLLLLLLIFILQSSVGPWELCY